MPNRAQRRAAMREQKNRTRDLLASYTTNKTIESLLQNGITTEDLRQEFERGRRAGFDESSVTIIKSCYAGVVLALQEEFGMDNRQCLRALQAIDRKIVMSIDHFEMIRDVLDKTGIVLNFDADFERVASKEGQNADG